VNNGWVVYHVDQDYYTPGPQVEAFFRNEQSAIDYCDEENSRVLANLRKYGNRTEINRSVDPYTYYEPLVFDDDPKEVQP
jgi:hypothetical protein